MAPLFLVDLFSPPVLAFFEVEVVLVFFVTPPDFLDFAAAADFLVEVEVEVAFLAGAFLVVVF